MVIGHGSSLLYKCLLPIFNYAACLCMSYFIFYKLYRSYYFSENVFTKFITHLFIFFNVSFDEQNCSSLLIIISPCVLRLKLFPNREEKYSLFLFLMLNRFAFDI